MTVGHTHTDRQIYHKVWGAAVSQTVTKIEYSYGLTYQCLEVPLPVEFPAGRTCALHLDQSDLESGDNNFIYQYLVS